MQCWKVVDIKSNYCDENNTSVLESRGQSFLEFMRPLVLNFSFPGQTNVYLVYVFIVMLTFYFLRHVSIGKFFNSDVNAHFLSLLRVSERKRILDLRLKSLFHNGGQERWCEERVLLVLGGRSPVFESLPNYLLTPLTPSSLAAVFLTAEQI